jgi:hypothetical protein
MKKPMDIFRILYDIVFFLFHTFPLLFVSFVTGGGVEPPPV